MCSKKGTKNPRTRRMVKINSLLACVCLLFNSNSNAIIHFLLLFRSNFGLRKKKKKKKLRRTHFSCVFRNKHVLPVCGLTGFHISREIDQNSTMRKIKGNKHFHIYFFFCIYNWLLLTVNRVKKERECMTILSIWSCVSARARARLYFRFVCIVQRSTTIEMKQKNLWTNWKMKTYIEINLN